MNQLSLRAAVVYQNAREEIQKRAMSDRGEISSWLILAAGLALVAIFIGDQLFDFATDRLTQITGSANANP